MEWYVLLKIVWDLQSINFNSCLTLGTFGIQAFKFSHCDVDHWTGEQHCYRNIGKIHRIKDQIEKTRQS